MRKAILVLLITATTSYGQGLINAQPGSGVPTDMMIGGLLGALIAPMISKGSDAKLVGGALGALAGGAYGTANNQIQQQNSAYQQSLQQEQMRVMMQQQQMQMAAFQQQMAQMNTASGVSYSQDTRNVRMGIKEGKMVRSPYSKFKVDPESMDLYSGEVLYDPFTGKPFKLP